MTVKELIQNLQATDDMEKEACVDINGIRYTLQNRLLGYDNHVDIIADERYKGNDFLTLIIRFVKVRYSMKEFIENLIGGRTMSKDNYIRIRLTTEQKEQIKEAAKRNKTNMSDYVLTATRTRIVKEK